MNLEFIYCVCCIVFFILCLFFYLVFYIFNNFKNKISDNELLTCLHILESTITIYKTDIYNIKINNLTSQYDIDPNSQTNAIKSYNEQLNILLNNSVKDIFNNHISSNIKNILSKYYTLDSLTIMIINNLKD